MVASIEKVLSGLSERQRDERTKGERLLTVTVETTFFRGDRMEAEIKIFFFYFHEIRS